jgi:Na+/melibiose symporter-like transporter
LALLVGPTLLFRTTTAIYRVPYLSLGAEMCQEPHGRTVIAAYRSVFGLVGTLSAATLSLLLFFPSTGAGDPKLRVEGYGPLSATWGTVMTLCGLVAIAGTWRYRASGNDAPAALAARSRYKESFYDALANAPFRRVFIALLLFFLGVVINATVGLHFYTWYAGVSDSAALSRVQLFFYTGALAGVPIWTRLARRHEKHTLMTVGLLIMAALLSAAPVVFGAGRLYGAESLWALYVTHALTGAFAAVAWVMPGAMLAEVADAEAIASGQRKEGIFFGLLNLGEKIAAGVAILIAGAALQLYAGLASGAVQTPQTIERIGVIFAWLPAAFLTMSGIAIYGYRLSQAAPATLPASAAPKTVITSAGSMP